MREQSAWRKIGTTRVYDSEGSMPAIVAIPVLGNERRYFISPLSPSIIKLVGDRVAREADLTTAVAIRPSQSASIDSIDLLDERLG